MNDDGYRPPLGATARAPWLSDYAVKRPTMYRTPQWMGRHWRTGDSKRERHLEAHVVASSKEPVYVQIVPGPNHCWQVVRVDLKTPFARGFLSADQARRWIGRAMKAGILPESIVEVESPTDDRNDTAQAPQRGQDRVPGAS